MRERCLECNCKLHGKNAQDVGYCVSCYNMLMADPEEDEEDTGPDYYYCLSCGYSCVKRPSWGGQCPKCGPVMEEGYF